MLRSLCLALALAASLTAPAAAQRDSLPLSPGSRVRVTLSRQPFRLEGAAPPQVFRGTLAEVGPDSLTLRLHPGVEPVTLSLGAVTRIDVSRGLRSRLASAGVGALGGMVLGASEFAFLESANEEKQFASTGEATLFGTIAGALVGGVLGAFHPTERWKRVRLPDAWAAQARPAPSPERSR